MSGLERESTSVSNEPKKQKWFYPIVHPFKEMLNRLCAPPPVSELKKISDQEMLWRRNSSERWNSIGNRLFPALAAVVGPTIYVTCERYALQTFTHLSQYGKGAILPSLVVGSGGIAGLLLSDIFANGPRVNEETNIRPLIENEALTSGQ